MTNIQDMNLTRADLVAIYNTLALKAGKKTVKDFKSKDEARDRIRAIAPEGELTDGAPGDAVVDPLPTQALQGATASIKHAPAPSAITGDIAQAKILLHNNDNTARWHVERVLKTVFNFDETNADEFDKAYDLMYDAHRKGKATVFEGTRAECETKLALLTEQITLIGNSGEDRCEYMKELKFTIEVGQ